MADFSEQIEREIKLLLTGPPPLPTGSATVEIEQGYLDDPDYGHLRLRRITAPDGSRRFELNTKRVEGPSLANRRERQRPMDESEFDARWPATEGRRLRKRRTRVVDPATGVVWEIDEFLDRVLVLAEAEFTAAAPAIPPWLAPYVVRDVTEAPAFLNINLAR